LARGNFFHFYIHKILMTLGRAAGRDVATIGWGGLPSAPFPMAWQL
jgi:hypothetical protein